MKTNWKIRFKNPQFIIAFVSGLILIAEQVGILIGYELDKVFTDQLLLIVRTILGLLTLLGIVTDPTTQGLSDSQEALTYNKPKKTNY